MKKGRYLFVIMLFIGLLCQCRDAMEQIEKDRNQHHITQLNRYIHMLFRSAYLWADKVPEHINPEEWENPEDLVEYLAYREKDRWSALVNDSDTFNDHLNSVETSFGYGLAFGRITSTDNYFAVVRYVHSGSPAQEAHLGRGDLIVECNGRPITQANYSDLFYASENTLTLYGGEKVTLKARHMSLNPILADTLLYHSGKAIGYLCYKNFNNQAKATLDPIFDRFRNAGVNDMILDLRYNNGGYDATARYLCSLLAPKEVLDGNTVLTRYYWNPFFNKCYNFFAPIINPTVAYFQKTDFNLDLKRIYILTGTNTASASELTITCLMPYLEVTTIGETTHGKYTGAILYRPNISTISNWGVQLIVFKYANADGYTDFSEGIAPDYFLKEVLVDGVHPLGDPQEELLAKALLLIDGGTTAKTAAATAATTSPATTSSATTSPKLFQLLDEAHPMNRVGMQAELIYEQLTY